MFEHLDTSEIIQSLVMSCLSSLDDELFLDVFSSVHDALYRLDRLEEKTFQSELEQLEKTDPNNNEKLNALSERRHEWRAPREDEIVKKYKKVFLDMAESGRY